MSNSSSSSSVVGTIIASPAERAIGYAEVLVKDIPDDRFGHMPHPTMNHPAFNLGHLSLYPNRILGLIGRGDLVKEKAGWDELFAAGCPCVEQDGRYPSKQEIVEHFLDRSRAVTAAVAAAPAEVFERPNPVEGRMRELFPTIGIAANFMLNSHVMMHLGQISAWRRAVGLPGVM